MNRLAQGDPSKFEYVENMNIHSMLTFVAHSIDSAKLEENIRKGSNVKTL